MASESSLPSESRPIAIPAVTLLEKYPPVLFASRLALKEGNAKKPIYQIHKWWARRLGSVFRSILIAAMRNSAAKENPKSSFYKKQDYSGLVVLDPFVGGGTSVVEAAKCGASIIGVDIDPVACFVTRSELKGCAKEELVTAFEAVATKVKNRIAAFYTSTLEDGTSCSVVYAFWVEIVRCKKCKEAYQAHPHYQLSRDRKNSRQTVFCRHCHRVHEINLKRCTFDCAECGKRTEISNGTVALGKGRCPLCNNEQLINSRVRKRKPKQALFALQLVDNSGKIHFKKALTSDISLYNSAARLWRKRKKQESFVPDELIPKEGRVDDRPIRFGYRRYRDLFNERQLVCLSFLAEAISDIPEKGPRELLAAAFSDCLAANNMFCYYAFDYHKLTPLFGLHAYHKVSRPVENNVWGTAVGRGSFAKCFQKLLRGKEFAVSPYEFQYDKSGGAIRVDTGESIKLDLSSVVPVKPAVPFGVLLNTSSERLSGIADRSVDLVLSDPPYYDNLAYSELSDFFHVWLKRLNLDSYHGNSHTQTPMTSSLFVNETARDPDRGHKTFRAGLTRVLNECHRVLKDEGMMVFTFHHRSEEAWAALGDALIDASFRVTNVFPVRSEGTSQFHSSAGNLKWDSVFCCRKKVHHDDKDVSCSPYRIASQWAGRLKAAKLAFGEVDRNNLIRALKTMYRCNIEIHSGEREQ
jgi:putative DNA methylase